jgi:flavin reductase (DIM6/NTAB) family NADH-FMN oxidoreductase RutF
MPTLQELRAMGMATLQLPHALRRREWGVQHAAERNAPRRWPMLRRRPALPASRLMPSAVTAARAAEAGHAMPASTVDVRAFRRAMGSFPTGVTVVTVASGDGSLHGMTVNSFSSVSLDPTLVLVCLNETSRSVGLIECAGAFVVNVLSAGQQDISRWFANPYRPAGSTMFDGVPFEPGVTGCPVLVDATASFDCRLRQSHRAGDHLILLGEVVALVHRPQLEPLIFHAGSYKSLAHMSPSSARSSG